MKRNLLMIVTISTMALAVGFTSLEETTSVFAEPAETRIASSEKVEWKLDVPTKEETVVEKTEVSSAQELSDESVKTAKQTNKSKGNGNGLLEYSYTQADVELLASLIQSEAGSDWMSNELQQWVGQVVMNRVASPDFENTIKGVIFEKGQYSTAYRLQKPSSRAIKNAEIVLKGKSNCPRDVIWQANYKQGIVVRSFYDKTLGTTSYFGKKA